MDCYLESVLSHAFCYISQVFAGAGEIARRLLLGFGFPLLRKAMPVARAKSHCLLSCFGLLHAIPAFGTSGLFFIFKKSQRKVK